MNAYMGKQANQLVYPNVRGVLVDIFWQLITWQAKD